MRIIDDILEATHLGEPVPVWVIDCETTMRCTTHFAATPHFDDNELLCSYGIKIDNAGYAITAAPDMHKILAKGTNPIILIGHNIKFDLHWFKRCGLDTNRVIAAYDTQTMFHTLTGTKFASLDDVAAYYGSLRKTTTIDGKDTETVPLGDLRDYCANDVEVTRQVFQIMMLQSSPQQRKLHNIQARTTMALFDMESNGLHPDKHKLHELYVHIDKECNRLHNQAIICANSIIRRQFGIIPPMLQDLADNPTTPRAMNQLLLEHPIKYTERVPVGTFKNGNPKFKTIDKETKINSTVPIAATTVGISHNKNLGYSMDDAALWEYISAFSAVGFDVTRAEFIQSVLKWRQNKKIASTYLEPMGYDLSHLDPSFIHQTLNQAATDTGRLSATKPNTQNQPPIVKQVFTNRYDPSFGIISLDFKQLEVYGAAYIAEDTQLLQDLTDEVDIHATVGYSAGVDAKHDLGMRRAVKGVVFGTIYGGGYKRLAAQSGLPEEIVKRVRGEFLARYGELSDYYSQYKQDIKVCPVVNSDTTSIANRTMRTFAVPSVTGRTYFYKERLQKSFYGGPDIDISHTEACNRPIQGWATGDVVPAFLGLLRTYKLYYDTGEYLKDVIFTNTIHDSVDMEGNFPAESESYNNVKHILEVLSGPVLKELYDAWVPSKPLPFELKVEVEVKPYKEELIYAS